MTREERIANLKILKSRITVFDEDDSKQLKALQETIKELEQEPKTGHWILQPSNKEQGERNFIWWKCSECGQVIFSETEKDRREYHAFCGRCGARMVEPQESEDKE